MTQEEIVEMAKEAGLEVDGVYFSDTMYRATLVRFAHLVAAKEREACAKVADDYVELVLEHNFSKLIAHNIRARGEQA